MQEVSELSEEERKDWIQEEYFSGCKFRKGSVDLEVRYHDKPIVWCEGKKKPTDIFVMFSQLIFTVYRKNLELKKPKFLCVFDPEKIAFIPYSEISQLYNEMLHADFDWTVTPSNHNTKEFGIIKNLIAGKREIFEQNENIFDYTKTIFKHGIDKEKAIEWIRKYIKSDKYEQPDEINIGNFQEVYFEWIRDVKPYIHIDWDAAKKDYNILDCDFYIADLISKDNFSIDESIKVLLQNDQYRQKFEISGKLLEETIKFKNNNTSPHRQFWKNYKRPPKEEFWDYITNRRDLMMPLDVRERLGAFLHLPNGLNCRNSI